MSTSLPRACLRNALARQRHIQLRSRPSLLPHRQQREHVNIVKAYSAGTEKRSSEHVPEYRLPIDRHATGQKPQDRRAIEPGPTPEWHATELKIAGKTTEVSSIFLRDRCMCSLCVDSSSKQRNFLTSDIPENIQGTVVSQEDGIVTLKWTNDIPGFGMDHRTTLPSSSFEKLFDYYAFQNPHDKEWEAAEFESACKDVSFEDYMESDAQLQRVLIQLREYGLAFITNVPDSEECVAKIAERVGPVKNTLYGYTWDVRSVPSATNVAYTSKDLGFHMDLLPLALVPQLQFLHCIRSSAKGGNSLFTDAYTAVQRLWLEDPQAVLDLCDLKVNFHYDHPESHLYRKLTTVLHIPFKEKGQARLTEFRARIPVDSINWSPPFQGPFNRRFNMLQSEQHYMTPSAIRSVGDQVARWRAAAKKFNVMIHRSGHIYQRLMKPGECVIFRNDRVLHARTAFEVDDAGKERWLRGCYVDRDVMRSKMRVLARKLGQ